MNKIAYIPNEIIPKGSYYKEKIKDSPTLDFVFLHFNTITLGASGELLFTIPQGKKFMIYGYSVLCSNRHTDPTDVMEYYLYVGDTANISIFYIPISTNWACDNLGNAKTTNKTFEAHQDFRVPIIIYEGDKIFYSQDGGTTSSCFSGNVYGFFVDSNIPNEELLI